MLLAVDVIRAILRRSHLLGVSAEFAFHGQVRGFKSINYRPSQIKSFALSALSKTDMVESKTTYCITPPHVSKLVRYVKLGNIPYIYTRYK